MSIKEKAEEYRSDTFGTPFKDDIAMAFSEGANWMLEKVADWFTDCTKELDCQYEWLLKSFIKQSGIDRFKKAMDE